MKQKKVILMAVGSSGGHVYPALAVAEHLEDLVLTKSHNSKDEIISWEIHFVHSGTSLERKLFSSFKYPVHEIKLGGLAQGQSLIRRIRTLLQLPLAFIKSFWLINNIKAHVILGTGGAITGPVLLLGFLMRKRTAIWEGNAIMGLANKVLSPFVSCVFSVFPELKGVNSKKQIVCAYPLRKKIYKFSKEESYESFSEVRSKNPFLSSPVKQNSNSETATDSNIQPSSLANPVNPSLYKKLFKVLILGGSQGSVFLNSVVSQALEEKDWRKDLFIYHQTGEKSFLKLDEKYRSLSAVQAFAFSLNIENYYKECDLVFSRAGSGVIAETAIYKKALVLIPLTHSAGGHQLNNAIALSSKKAVEIILERDFNVKTFKNKILELKGNKEKRQQLGVNLKTFYNKNGAEPIARWIYDSFTK